MARQNLTIGQVNQRLPLVAMIVRDIMALHEDLDSRRRRLKSIRRRSSRAPAAAGTGSASLYEEEVRQMESELLQDEQRLQAYIEELQRVGGQLVDASAGGVEFPGELGAGDPVWLCWQAGDKFVKFWHAGACGDPERIPLCHEAEGSSCLPSPEVDEELD